MNVRARIRARLAAGDSTPALVASEVVHDLRDDQLREALSVALPYLVRDEIRKRRHDAIGKPTGRGQEHRAAMAEPEPDQLPKRYEEAEAAGKQRREAARKGSDAAQAKRDRQSVLLSTPVAVGHSWKPLGECTASDLRTIAAGHRERGELALARAEGFEALADDMDAAGTATVAGLDAPRVREAFDAV